MRNVPHRLGYLSTCLVVSLGETVESSGDAAVLEEVHRLRWALRVYSLATLPVHLSQLLVPVAMLAALL